MTSYFPKSLWVLGRKSQGTACLYEILNEIYLIISYTSSFINLYELYKPANEVVLNRYHSSTEYQRVIDVRMGTYMHLL